MGTLVYIVVGSIGVPLLVGGIALGVIIYLKRKKRQVTAASVPEDGTAKTEGSNTKVPPKSRKSTAPRRRETKRSTVGSHKTRRGTDQSVQDSPDTSEGDSRSLPKSIIKGRSNEDHPKSPSLVSDFETNSRRTRFRDEDMEDNKSRASIAGETARMDKVKEVPDAETATSAADIAGLVHRDSDFDIDHDHLMTNLLFANESRNAVEIEKALALYQSLSNRTELECNVIKEANAILNTIRFSEDLAKAVDNLDLGNILSVVKTIQGAKLHGKLQQELKNAGRVVYILRKIERACNKILLIEKVFFSPLKDVIRRSAAVRECMVATLLILGESEKTTKDTTNLHKLCSIAQGLETAPLDERIEHFQPHKLHPEIAVRAMNLLDKIQRKELTKANDLAAELQEWGRAVCKARLQLETLAPTAATGERQDHILTSIKDGSRVDVLGVKKKASVLAEEKKREQEESSRMSMQVITEQVLGRMSRPDIESGKSEDEVKWKRMSRMTVLPGISESFPAKTADQVADVDFDDKAEEGQLGNPKVQARAISHHAHSTKQVDSQLASFSHDTVAEK